jgi:hypothetical protein
MISRRSFAIFTLTLAALIAPPASWAGILTGLHAFEADAGGNRVLPMAAYTYVPNDGAFVLWLAADTIDGPLLNGPLRDDAAIAVVLNPGVHTFFTFSAAGFSEGQLGFPGPVPSGVGMNLFFDGDDEIPGISVFAPTNTGASPPYPAFLANAGVTSNLSGDQSPLGSGSLTYTSGGVSITLTDFLYSSPLVFNQDRIANFQTIPEGDREYVGQFTLTVVANVPEPATMLLTGFALALAPWLRAGSRQGSDGQRHRRIQVPFGRNSGRGFACDASSRDAPDPALPPARWLRKAAQSRSTRHSSPK